MLHLLQELIIQNDNKIPGVGRKKSSPTIHTTPLMMAAQKVKRQVPG